MTKDLMECQSGDFEPMGHPGHLVRRLHQISVSVFLEASADYDVTNLQFATLQAVQTFPGIDQAQLGRLIAVDRQTTSVIVTKLASRNLITRERKDKRTYALYITGAARALIEVIEKHVPTIDEKILRPLSVDEQEQFMHLLKKLVNANNDLSRAPAGTPTKRTWSAKAK